MSENHYEHDEKLGFIGLIVFMALIALGVMLSAMGVLYALGKLAQLVGWT